MHDLLKSRKNDGQPPRRVFYQIFHMFSTDSRGMLTIDRLISSRTGSDGRRVTKKVTSETTTNDFKLVETIDTGSFGKVVLEKSDTEDRCRW